MQKLIIRQYGNIIISRAGLAINPLQAYNPTNNNLTIFNNNTLIQIENNRNIKFGSSTYSFEIANGKYAEYEYINVNEIPFVILNE